ncbi:MAG: DJ-1/PfpI family protein [Planctomycetes bacterium]|nr:DJ-1/PfpI family protein [Planctomycetota bacterium]
MSALNGKKVVIVIASKDFRDEEYAKPRALLEKEGAKVTVACSKLAPSKGMLGLTVKPDVLLKDVKSADYDAVVFVGGMGSPEYWNDPVAHKLAQEFAEKRKVTSAICLAPVTLAKAGLLKGRPATVWPDAAKEMKAAGAQLKSQGVVADGHIITGDGPQSAEEFGKAVVAAMRGTA